jgi:hypothetical protein
MSEEIFYQDRGIIVTNARFVTTQKTYALRNISSVHAAMVPPNRTYPILVCLLGLLLCSGNSDIVVLGILFLVLGIVWLFLQKTDYSVAITSNAGEHKSIISQDRQFIESVVDAINEAITSTVNSPQPSIVSAPIQTPITESINSSPNSAPQSSPSISNHDDKIAKLRELKSLLDSGVLTKDEFEQLKSTLL